MHVLKTIQTQLFKTENELRDYIKGHPGLSFDQKSELLDKGNTQMGQEGAKDVINVFIEEGGEDEKVEKKEPAPAPAGGKNGQADNR